MIEKNTIPSEKRCSYPGCNNEHVLIGHIKVDDPFTTEENYVDFPFCFYHFYVTCGGQFSCNKIGKKELVLAGPFEAVSMAEQVNSAREMTIKYGKKE
jgi:hypothetical protein